MTAIARQRIDTSRDSDDMPDWCLKYLKGNQGTETIPRTRWTILIDHSGLPASARHVALRLAVYATNDDARAWPSVRTLADATGLGVNTVRRALRALDRRGWIVVRPTFRPDGGRQSNAYYLAWPAVDVCAPPSSSLEGVPPHRDQAPSHHGVGVVPPWDPSSESSREVKEEEQGGGSHGNPPSPIIPINRRAAL